MAISIKFTQQEVPEETFPLDKMVALVKARKVFEPVTENKETRNPTIEFASAELYRITGQVREPAVVAFFDSRIPEDLGKTEAFNKKVAIGFKDGTVTWDVAASGTYDMAVLLNYLHDNLASLPELPAPEPEPAAEGTEAAEGEAAPASADAAPA